MTSGWYVRTSHTSRPIASSRSAFQKRARVVVAVRAHHAGVAVAEVLPLGHAEVAHRPLELARPDLAEAAVVVGGVHVGHDDLAELAARPGDEDHAMAGRDGLGHRPAGPDRLVVGMGMDGHQRRAVGSGVIGHGLDASAPVTFERFFAARMAPMMTDDRSDPEPPSRGVHPRRTAPTVEMTMVPETPDIVAFVAYGADCVLSGRTTLDGDRLSDMLNDHDEYALIGVTVERFDGGPTLAVDDVVVSRDEIWMVHAGLHAGRSDDGPARRRSTSRSDGSLPGSRLHPRSSRVGRARGHRTSQADDPGDRVRIAYTMLGRGARSPAPTPSSSTATRSSG